MNLCPHTQCIGFENCLTHQEEILIPKIEREMEAEEKKKELLGELGKC